MRSASNTVQVYIINVFEMYNRWMSWCQHTLAGWQKAESPYWLITAQWHQVGKKQLLVWSNNYSGHMAFCMAALQKAPVG